jgi:hypothetical protein
MKPGSFPSPAYAKFFQYHANGDPYDEKLAQKLGAYEIGMKATPS